MIIISSYRNRISTKSSVLEGFTRYPLNLYLALFVFLHDVYVKDLGIFIIQVCEWGFTCLVYAY